MVDGDTLNKCQDTAIVDYGRWYLTEFSLEFPIRFSWIRPQTCAATGCGCVQSGGSFPVADQESAMFTALNECWSGSQYSYELKLLDTQNIYVVYAYKTPGGCAGSVEYDFEFSPDETNICLDGGSSANTGRYMIEAPGDVVFPIEFSWTYASNMYPCNSDPAMSFKCLCAYNQNEVKDPSNQNITLVVGFDAPDVCKDITFDNTQISFRVTALPSNNALTGKYSVTQYNGSGCGGGSGFSHDFVKDDMGVCIDYPGYIDAAGQSRPGRFTIQELTPDFPVRFRYFPPALCAQEGRPCIDLCERRDNYFAGLSVGFNATSECSVVSYQGQAEAYTLEVGNTGYAVVPHSRSTCNTPAASETAWFPFDSTNIVPGVCYTHSSGGSYIVSSEELSFPVFVYWKPGPNDICSKVPLTIPPFDESYNMIEMIFSDYNTCTYTTTGTRASYTLRYNAAGFHEIVAHEDVQCITASLPVLTFTKAMFSNAAGDFSPACQDANYGNGRFLVAWN